MRHKQEEDNNNNNSISTSGLFRSNEMLSVSDGLSSSSSSCCTQHHHQHQQQQRLQHWTEHASGCSNTNTMTSGTNSGRRRRRRQCNRSSDDIRSTTSSSSSSPPRSKASWEAPGVTAPASTASNGMLGRMVHVVIFLCGIILNTAVADQFRDVIRLPNFAELKPHYPGYARWGGFYHNHQLVESVGCDTSLLLHDTTALRLSVALNKLGGPHSLGRQLIRLSKYGRDSVLGRDGLQYMYHPIAYGPFLADKYGFPTVSKLHANDPIETKKNFWGKQGILRVITYTRIGHMPKGHVALWDCNHFHQARDWIAGHSLITVEFWESPDSDCSTMPPVPTPSYPMVRDMVHRLRGPWAEPAHLRQHHWEKRFIQKYFGQRRNLHGTYNNAHYKNILPKHTRKTTKQPTSTSTTTTTTTTTEPKTTTFGWW